MQKITKTLVAVAALVAFSGCKTIDIHNGRVPNQYLPQAKKLEGIYHGEFNGVPGDLVITFEGNKPVVTYKNNEGTDILNNNCHSAIGNLTQVTVKGDAQNPRVSNATFAFSAGGCSLMVRGRELSIDFTQTNHGMKLELSILQEMNQRQVCTYDPGAPPQIPPQQHCDFESDPRYLYGTFAN